MGESIFHWENWPNDTKKWPKVGANMPRVAGNWSEFFFVHYSGRRSHFPAGGVQIVLNPVFKDFSRAGVSYFSPLHFPNCSSTTFAGWLWNIVTVKEWHFSGGVVQIVLKRVHKDFSQARFSYFSPLHFPNYSSTTSAIYFLKQSSFKGQVWNMSNHKKQYEQFWSIFIRLEYEQS